MHVAGDIILDRAATEGYSLSEAGWIRPRDGEFYFEVAAQKDRHRHSARAPDREQAVINLGRLVGYPSGEQSHFESAALAACTIAKMPALMHPATTAKLQSPTQDQYQ